jgi:hypothetical protein
VATMHQLSLPETVIYQRHCPLQPVYHYAKSINCGVLPFPRSTATRRARLKSPHKTSSGGLKRDPTGNFTMPWPILV